MTHIHTEYLSPDELTEHMIEIHGVNGFAPGKQSREYWSCWVRKIGNYKRQSTKDRWYAKWLESFDHGHNACHISLILDPPSAEEIAGETRRRVLENMTHEELLAWVQSPEQVAVMAEGHAKLREALNHINDEESIGD